MIRLLVLVIFLQGCAINGKSSAVNNQTLPSMTWPQPPEKGRIELVAIFSKAHELGLTQSFFSRLKTWFFGEESDQFLRPYSIAVYQEKIALTDPDAKLLHLFDLKHNTHKKIESINNQLLAMPIGVAMSPDRIFISDSVLNKVFILDQNLKYIASIEGLERPTGMAMDNMRQRVYVADTLAHQIKTYDHDGNLLFSIGNRGEEQKQFNFPSHIAYKNDRLFVNDTMNFRLQVLTHEGQFIKSFGQHGDAIGAIGQSKGIAVDPDGHVYVADALAGRVQIFDQSGAFLLDFGSRGSQPGQFNLPAGLAFWENKLYVADSYNGRVQVFRYLNEED